MISFRKKKDADDPRDEIKCSCGLCFGIGGAITIGAAMVIILILYLACMLEVSYFSFGYLPLKLPTFLFIFHKMLINIFTIRLIEFKGQDKPGGCYFKEPTTGFPKYLLNATGTVKTSSKVVESLTTPFPPTEQ